MNNFMQIFVEIWSTGIKEHTFEALRDDLKVPQFIFSTPLLKFLCEDPKTLPTTFI